MINRERLLHTFFSLASLDCPSFQERPGADFVERRLAALDISCHEDAAGAEIGGNTGNLFAKLPGARGDRPRLFSAHLDTVSPCRGKKIHKGETITGDGTTILGADDYAAVAAILEALQVIREDNLAHGPIELLFTPAEEVYSKGAAAFDYHQLQSKIAFVPDYDGSLGQAVNKAPTIISFCAELVGKASHAGFAPEEGKSAIAAAARAISKLDLGRIDSETTVNVGTIQGGMATNIVPPACAVRGEIRSYSHPIALQRLELIKSTFLAECDCHFTYEICIQAYETSLDSQAVTLFRRACHEVGLSPSFLPSFGGSDNNSFAQRGIAGIVLASAMHKCHTTEEFTTEAELVKLAELILHIMIIED